MPSCNDVPSTVAPDSMGTDSPPPPAFIRGTGSKPPSGRMLDRCNKSVWTRFRTEDGRIEIVGDVLERQRWPEAIEQHRDIINRAAAKHWIPAAWIAGWMSIESAGQAQAVSSANAIGLMQVLVSTAKWLSDPAFPGQTPGHVGPNPAQLADPELNVDLGARFIRYLAEKHNDNIPHMAAAYSHGSVACGEEVGVRDPKTGVRKPCPDSPYDWRLITHCGYIEKLIGSINRAIGEGYSGFREVDLGEGSEPVSHPTSVSSVAVGVAFAAGVTYAIRRFVK